MSQIGYKPAGSAPGVGEMAGGSSRASKLGSFAAATWITEVGFYGGRSTGSTTFATPSFWEEQTGTGDSPGVLVYSAPMQTISTFMSPSDATTGTRYAVPVTSLLIPAGKIIYGGIFVDGAGSLAYGQDASGAILYRTTGRPVPNPFNETIADAQGKISCWMIGFSNRSPGMPIVVDPTVNEAIIETEPLIKARFTDPDTIYGDKLKSYKIEVWNETNTSRLRTSNVQAASAPMIAAGVAEWLVTPALLPGSYTLRINLYDTGDVASPTLVYSFTVNSGGSFVNVTLEANADLKGSSGGNLITNSVTPKVTARWTHDSTQSTATVKARIRNLTANTIYRAEKAAAMVVAHNGSITIDFDDLGTTWSDMARGGAVYCWEVQAIDGLGGTSPWTPSAPFVVNATPVTVGNSPADGLAVTARPILSVTVTDANDPNGSHVTQFQVRPLAGGATITSNVTSQSGGVYTIQATSLMMPGLTNYEWRAVVTDTWGLQDTSMAWRDLAFVAAPSISSIYPGDNSEITSGSPMIEAVIDRTITQYRITIYKQGTIELVYDSGVVTASGTTISRVVPGALLTNNTDFDLLIWIRAADGLEATSFTQFRLDYPSPVMLSGIVGATVQSSVFDNAAPGILEQQPNVRLAWQKPSLGTVSAEDWLYYVIYRIGNGRDQQWQIPDRNQTAFVDTTAPSGASYAYYVGYMRRINFGLDVIESVLGKLTFSVDVKYTTITSENADDPSVTLHFWEDRSSNFVTNVDTVEILGQAQLDTFHSPLAYRTISGTFVVLDDASGYARYTARDIIAAAETLARPVEEENARPAPRTLYYRDPRGRSFRFVLTGPISETDHHETDIAEFSMDGIQVSSGAIIPVTVNDADSVDVSM